MTTNGTITNGISVEERLRASIIDVHGFPKPKVIFKDITPMWGDYELVRDVTDEMVAHFNGSEINGVVGPESRGFTLGMLTAQKLGVGFVPGRKPKKLPRKSTSVKYKTEYSDEEIAIHDDAIIPGASYLIHDDLRAFGGTARALAEIINILGGKVAGFCFVISLDFLASDEVLKEYSSNIFSSTRYK